MLYSETYIIIISNKNNLKEITLVHCLSVPHQHYQ